MNLNSNMSSDNFRPFFNELVQLVTGSNSQPINLGIRNRPETNLHIFKDIEVLFNKYPDISDISFTRNGIKVSIEKKNEQKERKEQKEQKEHKEQKRTDGEESKRERKEPQNRNQERSEELKNRTEDQNIGKNKNKNKIN